MEDVAQEEKQKVTELLREVLEVIPLNDRQRSLLITSAARIWVNGKLDGLREGAELLENVASR